MRVALFVTCLTDTFFPRVGEAVVRVLRHFGCQVEFPEAQTCCGQPAYSSGYAAECEQVAARMLDVFEPYEAVVTPSASCAAMIRSHYPEVLGQWPERRAAAENLARRTHEFTAFLRDVLEVRIEQHVRFEQATTFHFPCHARSLSSPAELAGVLARCGGERVSPPEHADLCCGFGGAFAADQPEISGAMLREKLAQLSATGAAQVICNEAGCALQMMGGAHRAGLPLRFRHVAVCLAESLGLMAPEA